AVASTPSARTRAAVVAAALAWTKAPSSNARASVTARSTSRKKANPIHSDAPQATARATGRPKYRSPIGCSTSRVARNAISPRPGRSAAGPVQGIDQQVVALLLCHGGGVGGSALAGRGSVVCRQLPPPLDRHVHLKSSVLNRWRHEQPSDHHPQLCP